MHVCMCTMYLSGHYGRPEEGIRSPEANLGPSARAAHACSQPQLLSGLSRPKPNF